MPNSIVSMCITCAKDVFFVWPAIVQTHATLHSDIFSQNRPVYNPLSYPHKRSSLPHLTMLLYTYFIRKITEVNCYLSAVSTGLITTTTIYKYTYNNERQGLVV